MKEPRVSERQTLMWRELWTHGAHTITATVMLEEVSLIQL